MERVCGFQTSGEEAVVHAKWPGIEYGSVTEGIRGTCNWHNQIVDGCALALSPLGFGGNTWTARGRTFWGEQHTEKGVAKVLLEHLS